LKRLRPIGHDDRLSVIDHLDELRSRLIVCTAVLFAAFCACFWQNNALINVLNRALPHTQAAARSGGLAAEPSQAARLQNGMALIERGSAALAHAAGLSPAVHADALLLARGAGEAARALPKSVSNQVKPITIGVGESFTTTLIVVGYFSLMIALPVLLYQLYAFVVPALNRNERRIATPLMVAAPTLFVAGAAFAYFLVLPPAVHFLQGYNSQNFDILVQAKTYYKFEMLLMIGIGGAFQVPLVLLGLQRLGVITSRTLTKYWRYAVVLIAIIAAALPGVDPVTMTFETLPLILLYLASLVRLKIVDRREAKRAAMELAQAGSGLDLT
jgi:sec-independent protein translocase protein TatC